MPKQFAKKSLAAALTTAVLTFAVVIRRVLRARRTIGSSSSGPLMDHASVAVQPSAVPARAPQAAQSRVGEPAASP